MAKSLVIVESPAKVRTINKILGPRYKVVPSMGHLIDLPKSSLGVDIEKDFRPRFIVVRSKQKILTRLKKEAAGKKAVYVATDPDREGEAIGWHLIEHIGDGKTVHRVTFQEITPEAVKEAFAHPRSFDRRKVDAQIARRVLDRIVGYSISPLLWKKVGSRLSAGRVQSVALRLIVERERAIREFVPQEYWRIHVDLRKPGTSTVLTAALEKIDGGKVDLKSRDEAETTAARIRGQRFFVAGVDRRRTKRRPQAPFITSTLQQEAFNKLKFNAGRTMRIAQQLYEGVELGGGESTGLITYMRTDSVRVADTAVAQVRSFLKERFDDGFLPARPNLFKARKSAQEAHEAIRPTSVLRRPEDLRSFLDEDQYRLYDLIWRRFVASQMTPAVFETTKLTVEAGPFLFGASATRPVFDGFLAVYQDEAKREESPDLGSFARGDALDLQEVRPTQHFTKPPPRYSDATLVRTLEEEGIGRPSTYAAIIQTLVLRNYVVREKGYFQATELGMLVCDLLMACFQRIMDIGFTARMEERLDLVEEGRMDALTLLKEFYGPFRQDLDRAAAVEKAQTETGESCPECGRPIVVKWGRRGKFLSCSGFPACRYARPFTLGIPCPQPDCDGELVKRRSRGGRMFYGCSRYPACTYTTNEPPSGADGKTA